MATLSGIATLLLEARTNGVTSDAGRRAIKAKYHVATLWHGCLAYRRCKDGLLRWLERAQTRLGSYALDGAARKRDREEFESDFGRGCGSSGA